MACHGGHENDENLRPVDMQNRLDKPADEHAVLPRNGSNPRGLQAVNKSVTTASRIPRAYSVHSLKDTRPIPLCTEDAVVATPDAVAATATPCRSAGGSAKPSTKGVSPGAKLPDVLSLVNKHIGDPSEFESVLKLKNKALKLEYKAIFEEYKNMESIFKATITTTQTAHLKLIKEMGDAQRHISKSFNEYQSQLESLSESNVKLTDNLAHTSEQAIQLKTTGQKLEKELEAEKCQAKDWRDKFDLQFHRADELELQLASKKREALIQTEVAASAQADLERLQTETKKEMDEVRRSQQKHAEDAAQMKTSYKQMMHESASTLGADLHDARAKLTTTEEELKVCSDARIAAEQRVKALDAQLTIDAFRLAEEKVLLQAQLAALEAARREEESEAARKLEAQSVLQHDKLQALNARLEQVQTETSEGRCALERRHREAVEAAEQRRKLQQQEHEELLQQRATHYCESLESVQSAHRIQSEELKCQADKRLDRQDQDYKKILESQRLNFQMHLDEKDAIIAKIEADAQNDSDSLKLDFQDKKKQSEEHFKQKEAELRQAMTALQSSDDVKLADKERQLRERESLMDATLQDLKARHQTELAEKDFQYKRLEVDKRDTVATLKNDNQDNVHKLEKMLKDNESDFGKAKSVTQQLHADELVKKNAEKEEQLRQKDKEHQDALKDQMELHQKRLKEIEEAYQRKEIIAQDSLKSIDGRHAAELSQMQELGERKESDQRKLLEIATRNFEAKLLGLDEQLHLQESQLAETRQSLHSERSRSQKLDAELAASKEGCETLRCKSAAAAQQCTTLQVELQTSRDKCAETLAHSQKMELDKDQFAEKVSSLQELLTQLTAKHNTANQDLDSAKSQLKDKTEQGEKLGHELHNMEVEFRSYKEHHGSNNQQQMDAIMELNMQKDRLQHQVALSEEKLLMQLSSASKHTGQIQGLEQQMARSEILRRELHNNIQELKGNIRVFCRVKPSMELETCLEIQDTNRICVSYGAEPHSFTYDKVLLGPTPQASVFEEVSGLVQSALDGYKVCVFAYGQTGSGKTYTMQGLKDPESWGLIPRSLSQIFQASQAMAAQGWTWTLNASFLEVYNEVLKDLLRPGGEESSGLVHVIKHDDAWGTIVTNLTTVEVTSISEIKRLMAQAARQRAVGATDMNSVSSRSHSVFALYLRGVNRELNQELHGALHLVDLAGSERVDKSGATGDRLKETQFINRSLSSLADVFLAKAECRSHVPFRNSKLTHLMEPCLNGQGKTLMVVNISGEVDDAHETLCSLRFAGQVSQCNTGGKPKKSTKAATAPAAPDNRSTSSSVRAPPTRPATAFGSASSSSRSAPSSAAARRSAR